LSRMIVSLCWTSGWETIVTPMGNPLHSEYAEP
jgi:hypothetical protein